ncbi:MAG: molybdopterin biosynthesis protein [Peptostreptococcales bacterium]
MKKEDRNVYIANMDVEEAQKIYSEKLISGSSFEEIHVLESLGRITYRAVYAEKSSPHYTSAAMDGIAVKAEKTYEASDIHPLTLEEEKDFIYINTGHLIPASYDAVIMIEDVIDLGQGKIQIIKAAYPWQYVRTIGEDIVATEMIIPSRHKIRPMDMGALISGGIEKIDAYKKPSVGIIPTGSELVESFSELKEGKIIESNSRVFEGLIQEYGGESNRYSPVEDNLELLKQAILKGVKENDILLVNAGSSAGDKDFTVKAIKELGEVVVHGIAMKPGKPTILGIVNNKPVIGIPGYPVSAYLVFDTFVKSLIYSYTGQKEVKDEIKAIISKRIVSSLKNKDIIRVNLGYVHEHYVATPLSSGAGATMSLVKADGLVSIPQNSEGVEAGQEVDVRLLKSISNIKETIVSIGSHDLIMDVISDMMPLSSGHVGSMGGIMAMKRDECHLAPIHLLDMATGQYNISYIKKYFQGKKMALIKGVKRLQGLIIAQGNPSNIKGIEDIARKDVTYVNRQRGAGTRMLLDYLLQKLSIATTDVKGYDREMTTHMTVAMAVKSGTATTGLGIASAAKAMDLDFIEIGFEDYDFLVPHDFLEDERMKRFLKIIQSQEFTDRVYALGGYDCKGIGEIIVID